MDYRSLRQACHATPSDAVLSPAWFLETATRATTRYRELLEHFPPGTIHDERNVMREMAEETLFLGDWMARSGIAEARFVGPYGPALPKRGARVKIKAGALVRSADARRRETTLDRVLSVTVVDADRGWINMENVESEGDSRLRQPQIRWAGAGGYWRWTDAANLVHQT